MVGLSPFSFAVLVAVAAAFLATHWYGARVCVRVLKAIKGTAHETHVREVMPELRKDMLIVDLPTHPRYWLTRRPSIFGYHSWNATVWLAIYANRYTIPDELVSDAHVLRILRWVELGLIIGGPILVASSLWMTSVRT